MGRGHRAEVCHLRFHGPGLGARMAGIRGSRAQVRGLLFLGRMRQRLPLRTLLRRIVAVGLPLCGLAPAVACGGDGSSSLVDVVGGDGGAGGGDAGGDGGRDVDQCGMCGCNYHPPPTVETVEYTPKRCDDAGADGGAISDAEACVADPIPDGASWQCYAACGPSYGPGPRGTVESCRVVGADGGTFEIECTYAPPPCGRRPRGFAAAQISSGTEIGRYLAASAALEAASVDAFAILAEELRAHGAPARLVRAARRAGRDEVRHARMMSALARRARVHLGSCKPPGKHAPRSLERIALENAKEGCVREAYGALLATWQSVAAADPKVRSAMHHIAEDETRHAELAWAIARWAERRLDARARARVARARRDAATELDAELRVPPSPALARALGLPGAARARWMARVLGDHLLA
jgi:hypothetical protein